jgi:hypothetical protein
MTVKTMRRTAALTSAAAALALPGAALAMPAPETGYDSSNVDLSTPAVSAPSSNNSSSSDDSTLAVVLASGALAIALGGVVYSVKLSSSRRSALS